MHKHAQLILPFKKTIMHGRVSIFLQQSSLSWIFICFSAARGFCAEIWCSKKKSKLTPSNIFSEKEVEKRPSEVNRNLERDHETTNGRRENVGREALIENKIRGRRNECRWLKGNVCPNCIWLKKPGKSTLLQIDEQPLKRKIISVCKCGHCSDQIRPELNDSVDLLPEMTTR